MLDYIIIAVAGNFASCLFLMLLINNRKQRIEINNHLKISNN